MMEEEEEEDSDSDNNNDMPPLCLRVANTGDTERIIHPFDAAERQPNNAYKERLLWDQMSKPLLDGGEGKKNCQMCNQKYIAS